jgi:hypothetical protein
MATFTLDEVKYEVESLTPNAKLILDNIMQVKERMRLDNLVGSAAVQALTKELSDHKDDFTVATEDAEVVVEA